MIGVVFVIWCMYILNKLEISHNIKGNKLIAPSVFSHICNVTKTDNNKY